jgi:hypothetical protein
MLSLVTAISVGLIKYTALPLTVSGNLRVCRVVHVGEKKMTHKHTHVHAHTHTHTHTHMCDRATAQHEYPKVQSRREEMGGARSHLSVGSTFPLASNDRTSSCCSLFSNQSATIWLEERGCAWNSQDHHHSRHLRRKQAGESREPHGMRSAVAPCSLLVAPPRRYSDASCGGGGG